MDLHTGAPFWLIRNGFGTRYPALRSAESCDVVVVGGGITGALCADRLTREGLDVVVLDQREPGLGSTAASTALLLYETDMELAALVDAVGREAAVRAYALGREAVLEIGRLVAESGTDCDFGVMHGLYLAHGRRDAKRLQKETELRNRNGFEARFLDAAEVSSRFGYDSHGAIESPGAARMDPLRFTRALLSSASRRGARVYARTAAIAYDTTDTGVRLRTDRGVDVTAHRVIFATGYELPDLFPTGLAQLHSTFALVTEPDDVVPPALQSHVVWESARPYSYLRATPDGRIMIGGRDAPYKSAALRDRALPGRSRKLEQRLATLHRDKARATAFTWSGTFGETKDSLPCIGWLPRYPRGLFALGLGGNGITFSAIASQIICDLYRGLSRPDAFIFRPDR
ncbi:MAG: FAD-dependent oxidoreductase [Gemmatimonadaceae bacterium]|nr:FAD-dependent oxidoreductase [Gemmatimonadaceae bacterium]